MDRITEDELDTLLREAESAHGVIYSEWLDDWAGLDLTVRVVAEVRRLRALILRTDQGVEFAGKTYEEVLAAEADAIREETKP